MGRKNEIGSNFWLSHEERENIVPLTSSVYGLNKWEHCILTSSGRGAIKLLFKNLPKVKRILLPVYTCSSVINPIESLGISCFFYPVKRDLRIDGELLIDMACQIKADAVYLQSYYGFDTLKGTRESYRILQERGILVVEDITHSWLGDFNSTEADYTVVSLRKWLELPDGGALLSSRHSLDFTLDENESTNIVSEFVKASFAKEQYFQTLQPADKEVFRGHYVNAKNLLQADDNAYCMSSLSKSVLAQTEFEAIAKRRKENAMYLHEHLHNKIIKRIVDFDSVHAVPLYYPIYVMDNRGALQKELASQNIYCPVHWPIPAQVKDILDDNVAYIYSHVLSLICDQRYDLEDMAAIVDVVNQYEA